MDERKALQQQLQTAQIVLAGLEQQIASLAETVISSQPDRGQSQKLVAGHSLQTVLDRAPDCTTLPYNLPRRETIFVGRVQEIADCVMALDPDERSWGAMISGMGGMGKTALALEVAHLAHMKAWFDAYCFVSAKTTWLTTAGIQQEPLPFSSLDAFIREFARLLGYDEIVQLSEPAARRQALLDVLRGRQTLLIWDNLESLSAEEHDQIEAFLRKLPAPNKAIVTSRRRMRESVLTLCLDRLALPEALQLLVEVGRRQPRVAVALAGVNDAARLLLCESAHGNPLALHWILGCIAQQGLSVAEAIGRLQDAASAPDLYAFLFASMLTGTTPSDRRVLSAFATFQTPATASMLAQATRLPGEDVGLALQRLVTLTLVSHVHEEHYSLHPLVRTYIHSTLQQQYQGQQMALPIAELDLRAYRRAVRFWVRQAHAYGRKRYQTFQHLEAMWPNLIATATTLHTLSGLPHAIKDEEAARLLIHLARCLNVFCVFRGYWDEIIRLHTWAYDAAVLMGNWQDACWRAHDAGRVLYYRAETEQAAIWANRMADATLRSGTRRDWAVAASLQGVVARQYGDLERAEHYCREALAAFYDLGEKRDQAVLLNDLGSIARDRQDDEGAERYFRQGLALAKQLDDKRLQASITGNLGNQAFDHDRLEVARDWYEQQLVLSQEIGRHDMRAMAQAGRARVLVRLGHYAEALPLAAEALHIREQLRERTLAETRQFVTYVRQQLGQ